MYIDDNLSGLAVGMHNLTYALPFDPREFYSRFRLTWATDGHGSALGSVTPWGEFFDEVTSNSIGEVEDYPPTVPEPRAAYLVAVALLSFAQSFRHRVSRARGDMT